MPKVSQRSWLRRGRLLRLADGTETWGIVAPLQWRSSWPYRKHTVREGERLEHVSHRYYQDTRLAWVLAELNALRSPWDIEVGQELKIPDRRVVELEVLADG